MGLGNAGSVEIIASDTITIDGEASDGIPSSIDSRFASEAEGEGGNVTITTGFLSLTNGGEVSASTLGKGNAGSVSIIASDTITIDGERSDGIPSGVGSQVSSGEGEGGNVTITTGSLSLTNGGGVSASTFGQGNAGSIEIVASDTITIDGENSDGFPSGVSSQVDLDAVGNGGNITITTGSLSLTNGGGVSASTFGRGNAGSVSITASDTIVIDGESSDGFSSSISSQVSPGAEGDGGGITITTSSLSLTDGGFIRSNTFGRGDAGTLTINAQSIELIGTSAADFPSGLFSSSEENIENTGDINIATFDLTVRDGAQIAIENSDNATSGNLQIKASNFVELSGLGSGLFNRTGGTGDAGSINIDTKELRISDNAEVGVNNFIETDLQILTLRDESGEPIVDRFNRPLTTVVRKFNPREGSGNAGTIEIEADLVQLKEGGNITALSAGGDGGNINLKINELLSLRTNSSISSTAGLQGTEGDGGNIRIDAPLIFTVPDENADITANAGEGKGGTIEINAQGIFGFEVREKATFESDITASSDLGVQFGGDVTINTPEVDPESGLNELPTVPIDADAIIAQNFCKLENDRIAGGSSFTIIGKGGLPPTVDDPITDQTRIVDWAKPTIEPSTPNRQQPEINSNNTVAEENTQPVIQQARGWAKTKDGTIVLTADAPIIVPQTGEIGYPNCTED